MRCTLIDILKVSKVLDDDSVYVPVHGVPCADPGALAYAFLSSPGVCVLMPNVGSVLLFVPYDRNVYNVHVAFLPGYRGKAATVATKDAFAWMFANTDCKKIIGFMSKKRRDGLLYIRSLGVQEEGCLTNCDGEGNDMVVFGLCA